jgi:DNA-binding NarL/FixJ family response regulator
VTLTTHSGVALLEDSVRIAARRACNAAVSPDVQTCAIRAVQSAQAHVQAAIARARRDTNRS